MKRELKRIICVDDDPEILDIIKMCLETLTTYEVVCCMNGKQLLETWQQNMPDFILLDVMMPEMDGTTVLKRLRENILLKKVPIVLMTARIQPTEVEEYIRMGATDIIPKPFDAMQLPKQINDIWKKLNDQ